MDKIIMIRDVAPIAMTEDAGLALRKKMQEALDNGNQVVLDFDGIELFATPFFNSSVGYFVLQYSPDKFGERIQVKNLSELGNQTYEHSYQNAVSVFENRTDTTRVGKITAETIDEQ